MMKYNPALTIHIATISFLLISLESMAACPPGYAADSPGERCLPIQPDSSMAAEKRIPKAIHSIRAIKPPIFNSTRQIPKNKSPFPPPNGMNAVPGKTNRGNTSGVPDNPYPDRGSNDGIKGGPLVGDDRDGTPDFGPPDGVQDPGAQLVSPEQMEQGHASGSRGNLYGGVIPGKNPSGGGGVADFDGSGSTFDGDVDFLQTNGEEFTAYQDEDGSYVIETYDNNGEVNYTYFYDKNGKFEFFSEDSPAGMTPEDSSNSGGDSGKVPWNWEKQKAYKRKKMEGILHELKYGSAIDPGGASPIDPDPDANKASDSGNKSQGANSTTEHAPQQKTPYVGKKPGSGLIGPTANEGAKSSYGSPVLPKGFHVVDPPAR